MKKFVVFLLLTAFTGFLYAQTSNCTQAIPNQQFQQKYNQIKNKPTEGTRLQTAKQVVNAYCFSSSQIKELASLFENDFDRFEFAKAAYKNTTDKENFYDVFDAFIYYSVVFKLHDFIKDQQVDIATETEIEETLEFPQYNYPPYRLYRGKRNCTNLISDQKFDVASHKIYKLTNDNDRFNASIEYIKNNCFATAHLMKIASLIGTENLRFKFAQEALNSVYDIDNYIEMQQVFNTPRARSEFVSFLGSTETTVDNKCEVTSQEYQIILNTIKSESFNSTKVNSAKHLIQTKKCYTSEQIKGIVDLFSYENSKLEIAMMAYEFATDQNNYYMTVSKALGFESSKKRLLDFINSKNR